MYKLSVLNWPIKQNNISPKTFDLGAFILMSQTGSGRVIYTRLTRVKRSYSVGRSAASGAPLSLRTFTHRTSARIASLARQQ